MYVRNANTLPDNNTAAEIDKQEFIMVLNRSPLDMNSLKPIRQCIEIFVNHVTIETATEIM